MYRLSDGRSRRERALNDHPYYKAKYIKAFGDMIKVMDVKQPNWKTGEDVYKWWLNEKMEHPIEGQMEMDLGEEE